jgi:hypothetical protein
MSNPQRPKTQAISLLEGILQETQGEADAEMRRLEEEVKRKEEAERRDVEAAGAAKRAEAGRRLADEEVRQLAAAERRQAELERMRIEELKAKGLWKEPEKPVVEAAPVLVSSAPSRPVMNTAEALAVQQAQARSTRSSILMVAALFLVVGGGVAGALYATSIEYVDSMTPYQKAEPAVLVRADAVAALALQPIPEPLAPQEAAAAEETPSTTSRPATRTRRPAAAEEADTNRPGRLDRTRRVF